MTSTFNNSPYKDYAVEHDRILIQSSGNGTARIGRCLALTGFTLSLITIAASIAFWSLVLPFYGLVHLWGAAT